jgi:hypothetical protein
MKSIPIILFLLCGIAAATQPFIIAPLVWDADGNLEAGVTITYTFKDQSSEQITATDGSCVFDCQNFENATEGDKITVSCKYGTKTATVDYNKFGQGVTFNEPSQDAAIAAYAAAGFIATAIGGGLYWLRRKKAKDSEEPQE